MARLILLLLIIGGLAAFILQNLSPIALTLLGIQSPVLPLGFWILTAIALGALTTLIVAALVSLSRPAVARRAGRSSQFTAGSSRPAWSAWPQRGPTPNRTSPQTGSAAGDDWEGRKREEWEDWEDDEEPVSSSGSQTQIRDREDAAWADWGDYDSASDRGRREEQPSDRPVETGPSTPPRTDFETRQEPVTRQQSGSVYSYTYRPPEASGTGKAEQVYDADYRVITPPFRSEPDDNPVGASEPAATEDDEDWGLGEDEFDQDREDRWERRDRRTP